MQYRPFGQKSGWQTSALGFGLMRLPVNDPFPFSDKIDDDAARRMLYEAIEQGVTYLDTAWIYHGGKSESFAGRALQSGWRQKVHLATKLPVWKVETPADFDRYFEEQIARTQTDHFDMYLLHALNANSWKKVYDMGVLDWAERRLREGRIRWLGFSFHDDNPAFHSIVDAYDGWTFCQIQYNYIDVENQAGMEGLRYAASKGLGVVVMEPLLGGGLVRPPAPVQAIWDAAPVQRTPVDWALQWLWSQPEVSVVLSGMSTLEQVRQNIAAAGQSRPGLLTDEENARVAAVRETYRSLCTIPCTGCAYCQPCPAEINIPQIFDLFNSGRMYETLEMSRGAYARIPAEKRADACLECQECESKCPQKIAVCDMLKMARAVLGEGRTYAEVLGL